MNLEFKKTEIPDVFLLESRPFADERGFLMETYKKSDFEANGYTMEFVQDNHSWSNAKVLRGLHYQIAPHGQGKLVRVMHGKVLDVAVDIRRSSPTFKKWVAVELSVENNLAIYLPPGFAHGFLVLSDQARVTYKCTGEYNQACERSLRWDDPELNINWPISGPIISKKDAAAPLLKDADIFD